MVATTARAPAATRAKPVMRFVDLAGQFQAEVWVKKGSRRVDGKNPMEMMLLEASKGTVLEIVAEGRALPGAAAGTVELRCGGGSLEAG